jgi:hypothetical protein
VTSWEDIRALERSVVGSLITASIVSRSAWLSHLTSVSMSFHPPTAATFHTRATQGSVAWPPVGSFPGGVSYLYHTHQNVGGDWIEAPNSVDSANTVYFGIPNLDISQDSTSCSCQMEWHTALGDINAWRNDTGVVRCLVYYRAKIAVPLRHRSPFPGEQCQWRKQPVIGLVVFFCWPLSRFQSSCLQSHHSMRRQCAPDGQLSQRLIVRKWYVELRHWHTMWVEHRSSGYTVLAPTLGTPPLNCIPPLLMWPGGSSL